MPLINCKIKLNLTWRKECVLSTDAGDAVFIINDTKMCVPVVTLSKEDNKDFIKQQNKGFQGSIYWNEYKIKELNATVDNNNPANSVRLLIHILLFKVLIDYLLWHIRAQMVNLLEMDKENIIYQELT